VAAHRVQRQRVGFPLCRDHQCPVPRGSRTGAGEIDSSACPVPRVQPTHWGLGGNKRPGHSSKNAQRTCFSSLMMPTLCRAPHRLDPPRMFGSHHHLERASLARRPVEVFSIPSHDQNTSLAKQGLSAASPHPTSLCRQDCCVPGGWRSTSSLRTSRRMSYCGYRTGGPVSA